MKASNVRYVPGYDARQPPSRAHHAPHSPPRHARTHPPLPRRLPPGDALPNHPRLDPRPRRPGLARVRPPRKRRRRRLRLRRRGGAVEGAADGLRVLRRPAARDRVFDLFDALLKASGSDRVETQSNDPLLTAMLHAYCRDVASESILFHDRITTHLPPPKGFTFRPARPDDAENIPEDQRGADYLLVADGGTEAAQKKSPPPAACSGTTTAPTATSTCT